MYRKETKLYSLENEKNFESAIKKHLNFKNVATCAIQSQYNILSRQSGKYINGAINMYFITKKQHIYFIHIDKNKLSDEKLEYMFRHISQMHIRHMLINLPENAFFEKYISIVCYNKTIPKLRLLSNFNSELPILRSEQVVIDIDGIDEEFLLRLLQMCIRGIIQQIHIHMYSSNGICVNLRDDMQIKMEFKPSYVIITAD